MMTAVVVALAIPSSARGQALADVARREAERRAAVGDAAKKYTDRDLKPGLPGVSSIPASTDPAAGSTPESSPHDKADAERADAANEAPVDHFDDDKDETYWRRHATAIRTALETAKADAAALDARAESLNGAKGGADVRELGVVTAGQKRARASLASLEAEWGRLEKEAQAANVPAAWIR